MPFLGPLEAYNRRRQERLREQRQKEDEPQTPQMRATAEIANTRTTPPSENQALMPGDGPNEMPMFLLRFWDIDVFDIHLDAHQLLQTPQLLSSWALIFPLPARLRPPARAAPAPPPPPSRREEPPCLGRETMRDVEPRVFLWVVPCMERAQLSLEVM